MPLPLDRYPPHPTLVAESIEVALAIKREVFVVS